ncbi:glyoxal oxidase N-terminus-domain-containing protein [Pilobolus umbonatus]|nr:glyoxal oxidase N-terminus-domain-containing protein [Pilobolus umbonatus]
MKPTSFVSIVTAISYLVGTLAQSTFPWSEQQANSPFATTGKMEQIGRTAEWNEAQFDSGQSAFSAQYDLDTNTYRPLPLETNTFCSAGGFLKNGSFISTGGGEKRGRDWKAEPGWQSIRHFTPCTDNTCLWSEYKTGQMTQNRWYPTVEQLPEGDLFILGGSIKGAAVNRAEINVPSYEFWPPRPEGEVHFEFLKETMPYNLYPFVFTLPDGNLFIFANKKSIIYDYKNKKIVRRLPDIEHVRSYPLTGGAIMLPLDPKKNYNVEILICGGSERMNRDAKADDTCGRINLGDKDPQWEMDTFVHKRLMPDGLIMADGNLLWVNGCQRGWAGYNGRNHDPTFDPLIYTPDKPLNQRWTEGLASTDIARMYHSVALTLPDGRIWIAGSNNVDPPDINAEYPTEFRVEYFSPPYLFKTATRPRVSHIPKVVTYGQSFDIYLNLEGLASTTSNAKSKIRVGLLRPGFSTHSMHMSQRYVFLEHEISDDLQTLTITAPPHSAIFPPGAGFMYVLFDGVPSNGTEIFVENDINDLAL